MFKRFQQLTIKIVDLVNSPSKTQRIIRDAIVPRVILKDFDAMLQFMDGKGFFAGLLGEVSLRTSGGKLLATPRDKPIGTLTIESLQTAAIDADGMSEETELPRHIDWHRDIYSQSQANVVVLCQPVFACILANRGRLPEKDLLMDANELLATARCVKANELSFDTKPGDQGMLLVQSVGVLVWGIDLEVLVARVETLERLCRISCESQR